MAIVLPHGVLFRGAAEGVIRKKLLEDGSIDAVIGMPANLFFGTSIPTTVIILKKNRTLVMFYLLMQVMSLRKERTKISFPKKILIRLSKRIRSEKMLRNMPTLLLMKSKRMISI